MSAADMDVASYLAQRKAKKNASKGGQRFKTFTATAAFMAVEGGEDLDGDVGAVGGDSSAAGAAASSVAASSSSSLAGTTAGSSSSGHHHHVAGPTASTLVAGEWVDDESQFAAQPRLVTGGVQIADLEMLDINDRRQVDSKQEEARKQFHAARQSALEASSAGGDSLRPAPFTQRRAQQNEFPSLSSSVGTTPSAAAPVASVWGRVNRTMPEEPKPAAVAEEPKPAEVKAPEPEAKSNVWRPKSQISSSAMPPSGPSSAPNARSTGSAAGPSAARGPLAGPASAARPAPPAAAPAPESDGLKKASNPWKPRRPVE